MQSSSELYLRAAIWIQSRVSYMFSVVLPARLTGREMYLHSLVAASICSALLRVCLCWVASASGLEQEL